MTIVSAIPVLRTTTALSAFLMAEHHYDMVEYAPPVDVDEIAQLLRIKVTEHADPDAGSTIGKIALRHEGPAEVWINPAENAYGPRRRFTLAHEIAHSCMHRSTDRHEFIDTRSTMNRSESYWNSCQLPRPEGRSLQNTASSG
ncbi:ImmA/IrrE family metallo-endopeptidase [Caballeronia sp. SEWSISQ10-4 2]|uniref:ImmA/IrrE family metallo-endopeptidase n=1 Tax=Caballeronia sp. SEWSISQ10-4 2 TaxID=2937438 RepID=UPI00265003A8|nr:ImmA/IrrE family metallo-endopeptidase [Caballeronia sp. SEWSISQ10-4 2]MDN7176779.1 ImmA/IrrE family metallo-endopeptidase [Caballeronia sp. SEWSISQ10-4 2]